MANRVVVGAFDGTHVLRASRPGFNVLNTGLTVNQLAFDSRWPELNNVLMTGTVVSSAGSFEVSLPASLTQPVLIFVMASGASQSINEVRPAQTFTSDELEIRQGFRDNGTAYNFIMFGGLSGTRKYSYVVMRNPYG